MAQVNITLNQEEILDLLSSGNSTEAFKELLTRSMNQFLMAESALQLGAEPYERTEKRQDQRNGELKRRSNVVKVFPNQASILRLMGSVIIDYHEMLAQKKRWFYGTSMSKINEKNKAEMTEIAHRQASRIRAA